jgi:hypothetical protein
MKALLLALFTLCIAIVSNAQIPAGTRLIGGSLGFIHQEHENGSNSVNKSTTVNINPTFGRAVKDNKVNGFSLAYSYNRLKSGSPSFTNQSVGAGIFRQKYLPLGNSFMAFGEGNLAASYTWRKSDYKSYALIAGFGAGLAYNANNRLLLTVSLPNAVNVYVNYSEEKYALNSQKNTGFSLGVNSRVSFQTMQFGILLMGK